MRLHTQTASLVNHLYSRSVIGQPEPEVGMGATVLCYTDRRAATVTGIQRSGKSMIVTVRQDDAKRTDGNGMSEDQSYEFTANPEGAPSHFRREKDGKWAEVYRNSETGRWVKASGHGLLLGQRRHYYDFSF